MIRYYFCYSSALDQEALADWKSQHGYSSFKLVDGEMVSLQRYRLVFDFPSKFWGGRVAGLQPSPNPADSVTGILFAVAENDWPAVEHKEGIVTGSSQALAVSIDSKKYGPVQAVAFTTHPGRASEAGPISPVFLATLIKSYRAWNFPVESIRGLEAQQSRA